MPSTPKPTVLSAADNRAPPRPTLLPHFLALSYTALIVYASLHPLTGWRDPGISPFYFLDAAWPRYWTVFDLAINTLAYLPLGFLLALTLHRLPGRWTPAFSALLLGGLLSFCLESLQTWLPSRVASNLDLACNTLGAGSGALLSIWYGRRFFVRVALLQRHLIAPIPFADFGLVLIGLWLLTQLSPETVLFGDGDLRHLLEITPAVPYHAHSFFALETGIIVCNTMAIGLIARALLANRSATPIVLSVFFTLALSIRTLAAAVLVNPLNAFAWLTPGATYGLLIGGVLLSLILLLPSSIRIALAGLALMCGAVLVNITPPNPYSAAALAAWRQGHFLNFNGLTRLTASVWPFLALPYLTLLARRIESNQG
ncbi:VanZ family protein [Propionivibrio sp.]|uniref:VanZ family protein n=1 Tax=Propionivibrio sp. TaxID=2212460 RepID=UPI0025F0B1B7|nr:VanZ family protein [Propionivibrio sp.]MBK7355413.1 VanZ family protein [Propionivibrio sp.]MBK8399819.1 VanZ family protein [Propionivibrio sp.]MBK8743292.1 VanZ family protein [Propionivibrio sp.]MBK8894693.1 VanZ family protein [Propionivibrio sp.]MBL0207174.1 VanZ family protein [Propionivibrio sp.]